MTEEKKEYPLDFFEAMEALKNGKTVANSYCPSQNFSIKDGKVVDLNRPPPCILGHEILAKWRIVETEKCWLEKQSPNVPWIEGVLAKELAREAIKRIETEISSTYVSLEHITKKAVEDAVKILKDLIGEK